MNIIFRVDASEQIGTGHVMRCLTLAKQLGLTIQDAQVTFICRELQGHFIQYIQQQQIRVLKLGPIAFLEHENEYEWYRENWQKDAYESLSILQDQTIDLLVVDHYGLDDKWEKRMRKKGNRLMVIDDLADRKHDCDLLLDQNIQANPFRYQGLVPESCHLLLGTDYLLLREEFLQMADKIRVREGEIKDLLVFFGGSDPKHLTLKTVEILQELSFLDANIHVVVGSSHPDKEQIARRCRNREGYFYYCQIDYMAKLMDQADLAIGAGGTTTWERLYLGLPALTVVTADNQVELTKNIEKGGMTISLGSNSSTLEITLKKTLENLQRNPHLIREMSKRSLRCIDKERLRSYPVVTAITEVLK
ncbi:UDP-2,4-diacetamido-2,4,6-trideoxy-beta-L-altropyranose hydrolase [Lederbergia sp. NSJ-179]|uniref:UDP-2,4-diacetamido-2,4, 6-trideoxy-beta-L-altropyranose hydrolase n=1 Tax=Lederbergia sp. NSJ-179 TaxID=2931402 RepID=UPI001FD52F98|nr:UDP-2,4-diacetamido-2,4,6-trideoxy-beta-L-altropyranose hydrolase [Lederbergia sp. NSJ-179]MCJ7841376.1 UDP-2,4-diacetamido-2,4,6-trideoxy-beta-L-altropyranose hydrolase [Lederbergia sp. NSJ-179]